VSPLRDDLLNPLAGDLKGENLRYAPVYDKVKEARKEDEDDDNPGEWQAARKKADFATVLKLASDALANKSKDLQLAVWFSEALIRKEGFPALPECLNLLRELQTRFWETLYPELEDGNPEMRVAPQEWFSSRCDYLLRRIPLTKKGLGWINYFEARDTTRERAAMSARASGKDEISEDRKIAERDKAVAAREAAAQAFDKAFESTPKSFYVAAVGDMEAAKEALAALEAFCDEKYGNFAPSFSKLKNVLEETSEAVHGLLDKKREKEPDEVQSTEASQSDEAGSEAPECTSETGISQPVVSQTKPTTLEDAYAAIARMAEFLRNLDTSAVAPYLLVRSLRWGELRSAGETIDPSLLVAPPTEVRQNLKRLFLQSNWEELLSATEVAALLPCGRAWLDLQRYTWHALNERGYSTIAKAICSELRALITDFPSLPDCMLDDDTPVANPDTKTWLEEHVIPPKASPGPEIFTSIAVARNEEHTESTTGTNGVASRFETALQLARSNLSEGIDVLAHEPLREPSGRERFLRQLQISQLCLSTGQFAIAYPILHDLFSEIEGRRLLEWESATFVVPPLSLLVRCIDKTNQGMEQRAQIYNLLCRLEPAEALKLQST
jgi:type VI secretion system protein ImpA